MPFAAWSPSLSIRLSLSRSLCSAPTQSTWSISTWGTTVRDHCCYRTRRSCWVSFSSWWKAFAKHSKWLLLFSVFFYFLPSYCGHSTSAPTPLPPQPGGSNPPFPFLPPLSPFLSRTKEELWGGKAGRSVNGYVERVIDVAWRWKPQVAGPLGRNQRCFLFFYSCQKSLSHWFSTGCPASLPFLTQIEWPGLFLFLWFLPFFFYILTVHTVHQ